MDGGKRMIALFFVASLYYVIWKIAGFEFMVYIGIIDILYSIYKKELK